MSDLLNNPIFIQSVGIFASALIVWAYGQKSDNNLKYFAVAGNIFFASHFFLLEAYAGMAINILNCFRIYLSIRFHKSNVMMFGFMAVYVAVGFMIAEGLIDWFPVLSSLMGTFAMYRLSGIKFRMVGLLGSASWLTYNIHYFSIGGIITEVFAISFGLFRIFKMKREAQKI